MRASGLLLLFIAFVVLLWPGTSRAADITAVQHPLCNIRLSGEITPGDAERLRKVVQEAPERESVVYRKGEPSTFNRKDLCLDSPGGSFPEALKIIQYMVENAKGWETLGTVVDKGAECYSACAYVFMAGRFHAFHGITFPLRQLHVDGTLGFHLPPAGGGSEGSVEDAFTEGVRHISMIMKQNVELEGMEHNRPFPKTLIAAALSLDPGQPLYVETVGQAGKWQITLLGLPKPDPASITDAMLHNACLNYGRWREEKLGRAGDQKPQANPVTYHDKLYRGTYQGFGGNGREYCIADLYASDQFGPILSLSYLESLTPKPDEYVSTPESIREMMDDGGGDYGNYGIMGEPIWAMYDSTVNIRDLPVIISR